MSPTASIRCLATLACGLVLTSCGATHTPGTLHETTPPASTPSPAPSSETIAQAEPSHVPDPRTDWQREHAGNHAYRERYPLTPEQQRQADRITAALRPQLRNLAEKENPDIERTRHALRHVGLTPREVTTTQDGLGFRAEADGICVTGQIDEDHVSLHTQGPSLDGGCAEPDGGH
ncbi:hypothetical protein SAMN04487905_11575 [Actinopolyspora xinjiangensis]|uniref:Lipoprotein n=1 Tax=Actinopolyspora xinjiangensis TaxID=405564 RepID=A0A1H0WUB0_9ACTN|nr:hypothetical protein [Actinopolyspora xinjiangensis]SDP94025.1 hypothetical protein SAMN04487905_11575 [Actinopolyspora xinjiangensis]